VITRHHSRLNFDVMRLTSFAALILLSLGVTGYAMAVYAFLPLGSAIHPDMRATTTIAPVPVSWFNNSLGRRRSPVKLTMCGVLAGESGSERSGHQVAQDYV